MVQKLTEMVQSPKLKFVPVEYKPAPLFEWITSILTYLQFLILATCLFGATNAYNKLQTFFGHENEEIPSWVSDVENNWMLVGSITFVGGNIFKNMVTKNNAFEVYVGSKLVYSGNQEGLHNNFMTVIYKRVTDLGYTLR